MSNKEQTTKKRKRDCRSEYLIAFILMFIFEQFMFHDWRIYKYYRERELDIGIFDKSNLPMTVHNE